ncbi:uncharacterized protein [Physcomitrium patens]|uniref:uncharacterized protein n=1 Tax=Physcomitrium patens TaxID=3218 RepID=UPI003CCD9497
MVGTRASGWQSLGEVASGEVWEGCGWRPVGAERRTRKSLARMHDKRSVKGRIGYALESHRKLLVLDSFLRLMY